MGRISAEEDSLHSVTDGLRVMGRDRASDKVEEEEEPPSPPPLQPPSLPSFGMGLKRQKSFGCPATHLTDAEVVHQTELQSRCASTLSRLASRFRLGVLTSRS